MIKAKEKIASLEAEKGKLEKILRGLPKGNLILGRNGNNWKWYVYNQRKTVYLPKKKKAQAEKLAYKRYLQSKIESLENEITGLKMYIKETEKPLRNLVPKNEEFRRLLEPQLYDEIVETWIKEPFVPNSIYPENLNVKTKIGTYVRSKSERDIYNLLLDYNIPFKYEAPVTVEGVTYYPDFTIMHPTTHKIFYWEHCGRIDDANYLDDNLFKYRRYFLNDIIPAVNLILTFETKDNPFDINYAEELIRFYFFG